jgi:hypothetical protein
VIKSSGAMSWLAITRCNPSLGTELFIRHIEPFDNSVVVNYDGYKSVTLSYDVIKNFLVEKI